MDIGHVKDGMLDANAGQLAALRNHIRGALMTGRQEGRAQNSLFDRGVIPAKMLTMLLQYIQLMSDSFHARSCEDIACIRILGNQAQGFLFPRAADQNGRVGFVSACGLFKVSASW